MAIIQVNLCYKVEISKVYLLIAIKTAGVLASNAHAFLTTID